MVPTAGVERTSVVLCASLAGSGTSIVVDGSAKVLRALGSRSKANEPDQFLKCCSWSRRRSGSGYNCRYACVGVGKCGRQFESLDVGSKWRCKQRMSAALRPRLPSKKRFQRVWTQARSWCVPLVRYDRSEQGPSPASYKAQRGGVDLCRFCRLQLQETWLAEVVANSVAWSRRVFAEFWCTKDIYFLLTNSTERAPAWSWFAVTCPPTFWDIFRCRWWCHTESKNERWYFLFCSLFLVLSFFRSKRP